jgi:hypothetical protein
VFLVFPQKPVGTVAMYADLLSVRNQQYPWRHPIEKWQGDYDPALEPELRQMRIDYFYGSRWPARCPGSIVERATPASYDIDEEGEPELRDGEQRGAVASA